MSARRMSSGHIMARYYHVDPRELDDPAEPRPRRIMSTERRTRLSFHSHDSSFRFSQEPGWFFFHGQEVSAAGGERGFLLVCAYAYGPGGKRAMLVLPATEWARVVAANRLQGDAPPAVAFRFTPEERLARLERLLGEALPVLEAHGDHWRLVEHHGFQRSMFVVAQRRALELERLAGRIRATLEGGAA